MLSSARRRVKLLLLCIGPAIVVGLVWISVHDFSPINIRSQASRSAAIGYGTLHTSDGRSRIVIEEIWKQPASGSQLAIGTAVYAPPLKSTHSPPDGFIVFFSRAPLSRGSPLRSAAIVAVYQDRVALEDISLSEAKTLCAADPSI